MSPLHSNVSIVVIWWDGSPYLSPSPLCIRLVSWSHQQLKALIARGMGVVE